SLHSSLGYTAKKTLKIKGLFRIETLQSPSQKSNRFLTAPFTQGGLWLRCKHVNKSEFDRLCMENARRKPAGMH
ncbi:MAG: hypothetical protein IJB17_04655, partial [Oscillospiraceae bacterium]|nr:hypothetical protein [Oscillospiraceae bacterium]